MDEGYGVSSIEIFRVIKINYSLSVLSPDAGRDLAPPSLGEKCAPGIPFADCPLSASHKQKDHPTPKKKNCLDDGTHDDPSTTQEKRAVRKQSRTRDGAGSAGSFR